MALELDIVVNDKGEATLKRFADTTKKSVGDVDSATAKYNKTAKESVGVNDKLKTSAFGLNTSFKSLAMGIGASIAAFYTIKRLILDNINAVANYRDTIRDLSKATGVSTDTIVTFQYAAKRAGGSAEDAAYALNQMYRRIGEVQGGSEEARRTFDNLGISLTDVNGNMKDGDILLREIASQLSKITNSTDKAAYAQEIFGRSGISLINTLDDLGTSFDSTKDKAAALGLTFTDEAGKAADEYNDRVQDLKDSFEGLKMSIFSGALPALQEVTKFMTVAAMSMSGNAAGVKEFLTNQYTTAKLGPKARGGGAAPKPFGTGSGSKATSGASDFWDSQMTPEEAETQKYLEAMQARADVKRDMWKVEVDTWKQTAELNAEKQALEDEWLSQDEKRIKESQAMRAENLAIQNEEDQKYIDMLVGYAEMKQGVMESIFSSFTDLTYAFAGESQTAFNIYKTAAIAESMVSTVTSAQKAYENVMRYSGFLGPAAMPLAIAAASAATLSGMARVKMIEAQKFALGGDFITSGPQMIMVGDNPGGRERVSVEPLSSRNKNGPKGTTINIVISEKMDRDYLRNEFIPELNRLAANG